MTTRTFDGGGISIIIPEGYDSACSVFAMSETDPRYSLVAASGSPGADLFRNLRQAGVEKCCQLTIGCPRPTPDTGLSVTVRIGLRHGQDALILHERNGEFLQENAHDYQPATNSEYHKTAVFHLILRTAGNNPEAPLQPFRLYLLRIPFPESGLVTGRSAPAEAEPLQEPLSESVLPDSLLPDLQIDKSMLDSIMFSYESLQSEPGYDASAPCVSYADTFPGNEAVEAPASREAWSASAAPEAPPEMPPPPMPVETATAYMHADMQQEVMLNHAVTVSVILSREKIDMDETAVSRTGKGEFETGRKLIVELIVQSKFLMLGDETGRREIDFPEPDNPVELLFNLKATDEGEGVIIVIARQDQFPLVKLELKPQVVSLATRSKRKITAQSQVTEPPKLDTPVDMLWIREVDSEKGIYYDFHLYSPAQKFQVVAQSKPLKSDRAEYVNSIYRFIEDKWKQHSSNPADFIHELRAYGVELFSELIPESMQEALWKYRSKLKGIQVISTDPFIPWELVHLKDPETAGMPKKDHFLAQFGITRWLIEEKVGTLPPETITVGREACRYIIPEYDDPRVALPQAEAEADFLRKHFNAKPVSAQPAVVRELLATPGSFDLLHVACHGEADQHNISQSALLLDNQTGECLTESIVAAYSNFVAKSGNQPLVTINACQTGRLGYKLTGIGGFAKAFLKGGAGAFVGALWSVGDEPARTFTETLYAALLDGANLSEAAIRARSAAKKAGDATWLAYVVYGHPHLVLKR